MRLSPGSRLPAASFPLLRGGTLDLPAPAGTGPALYHLQFRRFAGCPICNTHLHGFSRRAADLKAAGLHEVIFFHSSANELRKHQESLPFDTVPDPGKRFYARFGVETSWLGMLSPRALWSALRGVLAGRFGLNMENGPLGLPADFLVTPQGELVAAHYGRHADDQWSVDEVIALARGARAG